MNNKIIFLIVAILLLTIFAYKSNAVSEPYCSKCTHTYSCVGWDWFWCGWDTECVQIPCPKESDEI